MNSKPENGNAQEWLERAHSNLKLASSRSRKGVFLEDLCFEALMAVEKALKALCIQRGLEYPRAHSLVILMDMLESSGVVIPAGVKEADTLSVYGVQTRYPGWTEAVNEEEYQSALAAAKRVVSWVEKRLAKSHTQ
jgi:HEPN domain-containing protein